GAVGAALLCLGYFAWQNNWGNVRKWAERWKPANVAVTVKSAPSITHQPEDQKVVAGAQVKFLAEAKGEPRPAYQWRKDDTPIPGATNELLSINADSVASAGFYSFVVSNASGTEVSREAELQVTTPIPEPPPTPTLPKGDLAIHVTRDLSMGP